VVDFVRREEACCCRVLETYPDGSMVARNPTNVDVAALHVSRGSSDGLKQLRAS
jgi:hypothetical protein